MLTQRPIFLNCFARGGSNLLVNFFLSHPSVCISNGETHKVFKPRRTDPAWLRFKKHWLYYYPIRVTAGQELFSKSLQHPRKPVPWFIERYIDYILHSSRFSATDETENFYQYEGIPYTRKELAKCRLVTKGIDGMVYTVDVFHKMYPDAVFFGLIRNGLAVCEGRVERGQSVEAFARSYNGIVDKMLTCAAQMPNYHIVRYEDLVQTPVAFLRRLYEDAQLDITQLRKVRLQEKATLNRQGRRILRKGSDRQVFWYDLHSMHQHMQLDLNENQIAHLSPTDRARFLSIAGDTMKKLGYTTEHRVK